MAACSVRLRDSRRPWRQPAVGSSLLRRYKLSDFFLLLSFELFGFQCMPFFLLSVSISYLESGYFGLYHSQKILYSKTKLQFINRQTKE